MKTTRNSDAIQVDDWFFHLTKRFMRESSTMLSDRAFRVLAALEVFARDKPSCHMSNAAIADLTGKDKRTVSKILTELEEGGFIARIGVQEPGGNKGRSKVLMLRRIDSRFPVAAPPPSSKSTKPPFVEIDKAPLSKSSKPFVEIDNRKGIREKAGIGKRISGEKQHSFRPRRHRFSEYRKSRCRLVGRAET